MQVASSVPRHQKRQLGNAAGVSCCSLAPLSHHGCGWKQLSIRNPPPLGHTVPPGSSTLPHRDFRQKHLPTEPSSPFQIDLSQKAPFPVEAMPRQQHFSQLQQGSCLCPTPSCPPMAHAQLGAREQPHCHCPRKRAGPASPRAGSTQFPFCLCLPWANLRRETGLRRSRN